VLSQFPFYNITKYFCQEYTEQNHKIWKFNKFSLSQRVRVLRSNSNKSYFTLGAKLRRYYCCRILIAINLKLVCVLYVPHMKTSDFRIYIFHFKCSFERVPNFLLEGGTHGKLLRPGYRGECIRNWKIVRKEIK